MVNKALRILKFVRNSAFGKDKKGFPIFAFMESTRQKKVSRLVQKELSVIFQQLTQEMLGNIMVSVTIVRISSDLADANIFLSIFPVDDPAEALKVVKSSTIMIRKKLGESVRNQLRIVPTLQFHLDDSAAYAEEIDRLLKK